MTPIRLAFFLAIVLLIWSAMHGYVFWRLASVPGWLTTCRGGPESVWRWRLAASFPLARLLNAKDFATIGRPLEFFAANWVGVVFLLFSALLAADLITLGGWLLPRLAPSVRGGAAIAALLLSVVGFVQGFRPPVVTEHEVRLAGLPKERDGLVVGGDIDCILVR